MSAQPIDNFTFLQLLRDHFGESVEIIPDERPRPRLLRVSSKLRLWAAGVVRHDRRPV